MPDNLDDLRAYLRSQEMVASPAARDALKFILVPPVVWPGGKYPDFPGSRLVLAAPGRVAWAIPSAAAVALLPEEARRAYRLPYLRPALPYLKLSMAAFIRAMRLVSPPPPSMVEAKRRVRTFAA